MDRKATDSTECKRLISFANKHFFRAFARDAFFATEYAMEHLGLPEKLQKNIHLKYYEAGHMMYIHEEDLVKLKNNVGSFIENASR